MGTVRPNFNRDSNREEAVATILDKVLYPHNFSHIERVKDRKRQLSGIDVICSHPDVNGQLLIDEKAATSWANREISTFAFELSFLLGKDEIEGWFLQKDRKTQTTHWLCVWPRTSGGQINSPDDIVSLEAMLVQCKSLRRWARRMAGKSTTSLEDSMNKLRTRGDLREINWAGLRVMITRHLPEQPINLLVPKEVLRSISGEMTWELII
jgi:hypothetical protein